MARAWQEDAHSHVPSPMRLTSTLIAALVALLQPAAAQPAAVQTTARFGAFVDGYYAYDVNDPAGRLRAFTTQPVRHNTFALNLAVLRGDASADRVRGAFAYGVGDYVESNYAAEPEYLRGLIEANAGVRVAPDTWIDAGVFLSHIGLESPYSSSNLTLGRSLVAEYSPYYETGVRVTHTAGDLTLAGLVLNGWQTIAETNDDKSVGTQVAYRVSPAVTVNWSTYVGNESVQEDSSAYRYFSDVYATVAVSPRVDLAVAFDAGFQEQPAADRTAGWTGAALIGRVRLSPAVAVNGRVEYYNDPSEAIVVTGQGSGFEVAGASLGLDLQPAPTALARLDVRGLTQFDGDALFPQSDGDLSDTNVTVHASLALTF